MNEKQALEVIKGALDFATSKGAFANLDQTAAIIEAFNVLSREILKVDTKPDEHSV